MIAGLKPYPEYKDSGVPWLGEVPEHWEVRRLGQIGRLSKGNGGNKEDEVATGVPCVRYGDLHTTHTYFIKKSRSFVSPAKSEEYTRITFGDVLFAASGEPRGPRQKCRHGGRRCADYACRFCDAGQTFYIRAPRA